MPDSNRDAVYPSAIAEARSTNAAGVPRISTTEATMHS